MKNLLHSILFLAGSGLSLVANDAPAGIIAPDAKVEQLATGMKFTEGPVWMPEKEIVIFSDIPNSKLMQWSSKDGLEPYRETENSNGNILDSKGQLLTCQHSGRNIVAVNKNGNITVLTEKHDGGKFNSPNDLAQHKDGSIWFTDPSYGLGDKAGDYDGKWVFRFDVATGKTSVIYKRFDMPNGIAFSPDYKTVYISDTGKVGIIRAFSVWGDSIGHKPIFEIPIRCDGMRIDTEGNIYTTSKGGIHVYDKSGKKLGVIATPEEPANVCFGGKDFDTLFITARTSLYSVKTLKQGMR